MASFSEAWEVSTPGIHTFLLSAKFVLDLTTNSLLINSLPTNGAYTRHKSTFH